MEDKDGEEEEVGLELIVNNADEEEAEEEEESEVEPLCRFPRIVGEVIKMPSNLWMEASP